MTMMLRISFGLQLKDIRKKKNLTLKQAAELIGTSESQLSKVENGTYSISIDKIEPILEAYGLQITLTTIQHES